MSWRRLSHWYQHAVDDLDSWFEKREWLAILIALALFLALAVHDAILEITYYGMPIVPPRTHARSVGSRLQGRRDLMRGDTPRGAELTNA